MDFSIHFEPSMLYEIIPLVVISLIIFIFIYRFTVIGMNMKNKPGFNKVAVIFAYAFFYVLFAGSSVFAIMGATPYALIGGCLFVFSIFGMIIGAEISRKRNLHKIESGSGFQTTGKMVYSQKISSTQINSKVVNENYVIYFEYVDEETGNIKTVNTVNKLSLREVVYYNTLKMMPIMVYSKFCKIMVDVPSNYVPSEEDIQLYKERDANE